MKCPPPRALPPAHAVLVRPSKQSGAFPGTSDGRSSDRTGSEETDERTDLQTAERKRARESRRPPLSLVNPSSTASLALTPVALARPRPPRAASHPHRRPCRPPSVRDCLGGRGWVGQSVPSLSDFQCHHHYHPSSPFTSPKSSSPC